MYDSIITGKENASKNWNCIVSMFLASFEEWLATLQRSIDLPRNGTTRLKKP